jgi:hypothetical protein
VDLLALPRPLPSASASLASPSPACTSHGSSKWSCLVRQLVASPCRGTGWVCCHTRQPARPPRKGEGGHIKSDPIGVPRCPQSLLRGFLKENSFLFCLIRSRMLCFSTVAFLIFFTGPKIFSQKSPPAPATAGCAPAASPWCAARRRVRRLLRQGGRTREDEL